MKKIIRYFSFKSLINDNLELKDSFKLKIYIRFLLGFFVLGIVAGLLFRLNLICIGIIVLSEFFMVPYIIKRIYSAKYNEKKFRDVDIYLHQMLYSFSRSQKIDIALKDTYKIAEGELKECIKKAINELSFGVSEDVYKDAFEIIEDKYGCDRMRALHRYLSLVETKGGRYKKSLQVLNMDFDAWVSGVYKFISELKKIRTDTIIGVVISIGLALVTSTLCIMLGKFGQIINITKSLEYNISTTAFLIGCLIFTTWTIGNYKGDFLSNQRTDKQILVNYKNAFKIDLKKLYLKTLPLLFLLLLASIILFLFKLKIYAIYFTIALLLVLIHPIRLKQRAKKIALDDLRDGFTCWLRDLSLGLSRAPLYVALEQSYKECPVILKEDLNVFLNKLDMEPMAVEPYYEFLSEFDCLDVLTAVRTLYSINDMDSESADETINMLVERNNELALKFDGDKYKNITSSLRFLEYFPSFLAAIKISIDLILVITKCL